MLRQVTTPELWKMYKTHQNSYWSAEEIDLHLDNFEKLPQGVRKWMTLVLSWFANADVLVMANIPNFMNDLSDSIEGQAFLGFQQMIEMIHTETYHLLLETYLPEEERVAAYASIREVPTIRAKKLWLESYSNANFQDRLIVWGACELIMFSASFATIFYCKAHHSGSIPGCFQANEFIARDEGLHCKFGCALAKIHGVSERAHQIIREACNIERAFVTDAMSEYIVGITSKDMCDYVNYCGDILCGLLEIPKIYNTPLPTSLNFMETINMKSQANFFERKVTAYTTKPLEKSEWGLDDNF